MQPTSNRRRFRPLLWLGAFLLPPLLLGIPSTIAFLGGELFVVDSVVAAQAATSDSLFGPAYGSPDACIKLRRSIVDGPQVLVMGSSRVLGIRQEFIRPEFSFYNAGRISDDLWNFRQALMLMPPDRLPSHVIIGIDQYKLNAAKADYSPGRITREIIRKRFSVKKEGWGRLGEVMPLLLKDLFAGKIHLPEEKPARVTIGLAAHLEHSGYRSDGSYRYGPVIDTPPLRRSTDERLSAAFDRMRKSGRSFEHGDDIHRESVDEIGRLLDWCAARRIHVIAYLPPYSPSVIRAMRQPGRGYAYLDIVEPALAGVFARYGFQCHDFTHASGSSDEQFIDGFHSSERVDAGILLGIAAKDPAAAGIIDISRIKELLSESRDPLVLLP